MKVIDIIQLACAYLNCYGDYLTYFKPLAMQASNNELPEPEEITLPEEKEETLELLLLSFNNVLETLLKKIPLFTTQTLQVNSNKINFSSLEKNINSVISIKQNNKKINFTVLDDSILINNFNFIGGDVTITYSYFLPKVTQLNDDVLISNFSKKQTFALGIASEFCFIKGLFDDAEIWQNRFNKELESDYKDVLFPKEIYKNFVMPKRNWR